MFQRLTRTLEKGVDLLDVKARLTMRSFERVGIVWIGYFAASAMLVLGLGALLAALVVSLAPFIGTGAALAIAGAGIALMAGIVFVAIHIYGDRGRPSQHDLHERSARLETQFHDALVGNDQSPQSVQSPSDLKQLLNAAIENPVAVAGAAFAVVSVLGVKRTAKLVSIGATMLGVVESMLHKGDDHSAAPNAPASGSTRATAPPVNGAEHTPRNQSANGQHRESKRSPAPLRS